MQIEKNNPKVMNGWVMYDWANSVYNLVIASAIFPIFYQNQTSVIDKVSGNVISDKVQFWGFELINTELYNYVFSFAYLIVVFTTPILSGVADFWGNKKFFLKLFCAIGSLSCICLYFFNAQHLEWSMFAVMMACVGFWGSLVFYNAYLPEIAEPALHDKLSARGFTMGYIGSTILLVASLIAIKVFNFNVRYVFILVGLWWIGFAHITYWRLPKSVIRKNIKNPFLNGFKELKKVFGEIKEQFVLRKFLLSYFVYNCGVQTVMIVAVPFASKEIFTGSDKSGLIAAVILIQLVGAVGAWLMSNLSSKIGNFNVIKISVFIWMIICILGYFIKTQIQFYFLACTVGFVMGSIQSMSRSTFAKLIPATNDNTSYFSFFDVAEKIGLVIGVFLFGFIEGLTNNMRLSIVFLIIIFILGFTLLLRIGPKEGKAALEND
ncbi:MAG: MFS transporter [Bacteroidetes bacterium]|nr:MFS transporter [Bacteroidota bacterium]